MQATHAIVLSRVDDQLARAIDSFSVAFDGSAGFRPAMAEEADFPDILRSLEAVEQALDAGECAKVVQAALDRLQSGLDRAAAAAKRTRGH